MYVSQRTSEIPELTSVRKQLAARYGQEFVKSAVSDASAAAFGVNRIVLEKLATAPPPPAAKLTLLREIAAQHNVEWEPSEATTASMLGPPPSVLVRASPNNRHAYSDFGQCAPNLSAVLGSRLRMALSSEGRGVHCRAVAGASQPSRQHRPRHPLPVRHTQPPRGAHAGTTCRQYSGSANTHPPPPLQMLAERGCTPQLEVPLREHLTQLSVQTDSSIRGSSWLTQGWTGVVELPAPPLTPPMPSPPPRVAQPSHPVIAIIAPHAPRAVDPHTQVRSLMPSASFVWSPFASSECPCWVGNSASRGAGKR